MDLLNTCFETTNEVRALAYYSHLLPAVIVLVLAFVTLKFAQNRTKALLFFSFSLLLALWLIGDVIAWTSNNYYVVAAFWSTLDYLNILFYLFILAFVVVETREKNDLGWFFSIFIFLAALFPFLLTFAGMAVLEFDEPNCEMYSHEQLTQYKLVMEWIVIGLIAIVGTYRVIKIWKNSVLRNQQILLLGSVIAFLAIFSSSEYLATVTEIFEINLYALFVLPIFVVVLSYIITDQKTFTLSVDSVWFVRILFGIFVLIGISNLILADGYTEILVTGASTLATIGFGVLLLRSAAREAKQRQQIETLATKLEKANKRLKQLDQMKSEFVSIASHQLRSPLTSIRGYTSMMMEGSYGKLPQRAKEVLQHIADSSRLMAASVEDYLNVSRIESGNMKYEYSDFNLKDLAETVADELRPEGMKRGLLITFKSDVSSRGVVHADIGKTKQIIQNLVDNSMKYTPKGKVNIFIHDDKKAKRIFVDITDTGIGMSEDTLHTVFEKFERAHNANSVNVTGTGLGLFVARTMAEAMKGDVRATSKGENQGSTFTLELPLAM